MCAEDNMDAKEIKVIVNFIEDLGFVVMTKKEFEDNLEMVRADERENYTPEPPDMERT